MSAVLALADDGLTVEFDGADECADLTADEAEAVTGRIRQWVNDFPIADVVLAFRGRVWIALAYASWAEWCECELGGLKLPAPKRREVVAELTEAGMSGEAIADTLDVSNATVSRDRAALTNVRPDKVTGQDGKTYSPPRPKPTTPQPESPIVDAEIVCRDCDGFGCETCVPEEDTDDKQVAEPLAEERIAPVVPLSNKAPQPPPDAAPQKRRPLPDAFGSANFELRKAVERVVRLTGDDRLKKNKDQIVGSNLSDLIRARDALTSVIQQLEG
ncbi:hypothetical protein [Mycolicibacterium brisbanense]